MRSRLTDPVTSATAAVMSFDFSDTHCSLILESLVRHGNGTIYDLEKTTRIDHVSVARRMKELERAGLAHRTEVTQPSPLGRPCGVWKATEKAHENLR